mmetsp:Transcript_42254/g.78632  ORF Transcript_42254/g.78632 Transcript_42254/m.78632 type:complete len:799 (-) Transcript_42254:267-2663(-)
MKVWLCVLLVAALPLHSAQEGDDSGCMTLLQVTHERIRSNSSDARDKRSKGPVINHTGRRHRVEHVPMLSEQPFWWMMAGLIILVSVVVIRMEVQDPHPPQKEKDTVENAIEAEHKMQDSIQIRSSTPRAEADKEMETFYSPENLRRLCFCFVALNTCMILWGIAQEFIMTNVYIGRNGEGQTIPSALFLVLGNRLTAAAFSALILVLRRKQLFFDGCIDSLPPAVSNSMASWCQYSSLSYISFGLQTTAKSTKILPVVMISSLRGKTYSLTDYAECIVLTASCFVFGHESESGYDSVTTTTGLVLLGIYIVCDSLTPHLQDVLFTKHKDLDVVQATLAMSTFAVAFIAAELLLTGAMWSSFSFIWQCPEALTHMLVLSLASTVTQYMISYTIKHFGPVVYTLIASTRQVLSVLISCALFHHDMSGLSIVAMSIIFGTLSVRALRPLARDHQELVSVEPAAFQRVPLLNFSSRLSRFSPLFICTMAILVVYMVYSLLQEFLSSHTFDGALFNFPLMLVAISHISGALLSLGALWAAGHPLIVPGITNTILPATTDLVATSLQHAALYVMFFPAQSLMKTLKVLPVMLVGSCLQNRVYSRLDYAEGFLLTCFVAFFVWDFQINDAEEREKKMSMAGIFMMFGYLTVDAFTSNFQDHIYQTKGLEPGHMLLGMELFSGVMAWILAALGNELVPALQFIVHHPDVLFFLAIFAMSAAVGAFSCVLTVRLFGPAVFTLIMTARAILSLLLSVVCFQHEVAWEELLCLIVVSLVMLISSARRVSVQMRQLDMSKSDDRMVLTS